MTIKSSIDIFLDHLSFEKRSSRHTITAYQSDLYAFADFMEVTFEVNHLPDVGKRMIGAFMADLAEHGISSRSIHRKLSAVQSLFGYGVSQGWLAQNPARGIQRPKMSKHLPKVVRSEQVDDLFDEKWFSGDFEGQRDAAILAVFYACGLRREELIGLRWSDIDLNSGQIKVLGKRNKERLVPIGEGLTRRLNRYAIARENMANTEQYFFLTAKGKKMYPSLVYSIVKKYLSNVTTMEQKSPHVLRHTFATHLLNEGANLQSIKELLGHSSLGTTQVYTHTSLEKLKDVYKLAHPRSKK